MFNPIGRLVPILIALAVFPVRSEKPPFDETLLGGGATFPNVLYQNWFEAYHHASGVRVAYKPVGSGAGLNGLRDRAWDFAASDFLPGVEEKMQFPAEAIEFPTCLGGVAIPFNLPGIAELRLPPDVVAGIFSGAIRKWNEYPIRAANPGAFLPNLDIKVVHRSDASGTTYIFSEYLSKVDSSWARRIGKGKKLEWPVGFGLSGNQGICDFMSRVPGSISYLEWSYAIDKKLSYAALRNFSGAYVKPQLRTFYAAAKPLLGASARASLTDTKAPEGYSITSLTWILAYREQAYQGRTRERAENLQRVLLWMLSPEAQAANPALGFGSLSPELQEAYREEILSMTFLGKPILSLPPAREPDRAAK